MGKGSKVIRTAYRLAILGNPDGWYVRDLRRAAAARTDFFLEVVSFSDLRIECSDRYSMHVSSRCRSSTTANAPLNTDEPALSGERRLDGQFDAVLVRTMPMGSLEQVIFRMNALQILHRQGTRVLNPPRTLEIAIDKWLTLDYARQAGIDVPVTICCQDRESALAAFESLGRQAVVKPLSEEKDEV